MGNNPGYLMEEVHGFIDHSVDIVFDIYYHARNQDFMRALDVFFRYAKGTWTDKGYRQVVVWTLAYFLMVITLILVMELLPKLKLNVRYFGAAHNFAMSMFSAWMFYGSALTWYDNLKADGFSTEHIICDDKLRLRKGLDIYFYWFFVSKYLEYIDTVLLIANRKYSISVGFALQIYHHSTTASIAWVAYFCDIPIAWLGVISNTLVHVVMYMYFALVLLDRDLRKYGHWVTKLQLTQFYITFGSSLYWVYVVYFERANDCGGSVLGSWYTIILYASYLVFFLIFDVARKRSMRLRKSKTGADEAEPAESKLSLIQKILSSFQPICAASKKDD